MHFRSNARQNVQSKMVKLFGRVPSIGASLKMSKSHLQQNHQCLVLFFFLDNFSHKKKHDNFSPFVKLEGKRYRIFFSIEFWRDKNTCHVSLQSQMAWTKLDSLQIKKSLFTKLTEEKKQHGKCAILDSCLSQYDSLQKNWILFATCTGKQDIPEKRETRVKMRPT